MPTNGTLEAIDRDDRRRVAYLTGVRRRWSRQMFQQLRHEYAQLVADRGEPVDRTEAGHWIEECPSYGWFGWLERGGQQLKWRVINSIVAGGWDLLRPVLDTEGPATAILDPDLVRPDWYEAWDIHCQPGGVWGDDASAFVYELGTQVLHIGQNRGLELHHRFVGAVMSDRRYRRIVDLGSGFGKSTRPIKEHLPDAEVTGVELSGPCVRLAAARANEEGLAIEFRQADAAHTGLDTGSVDLVTGTMLLHELPVPALRDVFAETARLLAPGGDVRFLEFCRTGDDFRDAVMDDHAWRNNEPFMPGLMDLDVAAELAAVGLADARWVPFDERIGELLPDGHSARDEWHFPWAVLAATREVA